MNSTNTHQGASNPSEPGPDKPEGPESKSFFRDLLTRRVPHILGAYLAGSWIILEFMDWLVNRYPISPHLSEFCLIALAAMVPTVILLAWFHGKPGRDQWTRVEKIGIPTNVLATAILLISLFNGKDLGATTFTVPITDEYGQEFERTIPKSEFRKKVAIFSLENETGDTAYDWMMHAIPDMIKLDLIQDMYLDIKSTYGFYENVRREGFPGATGIPLALKKKIAGQQYMDHFITGTLHQQDDQLSVHIALHETRTTKLLVENTFTGNEFLEIIDEISVWIKEELSVPAHHMASTVDLPASEIITTSSRALETCYAGMNECFIRANWDKGLSFLKKSVQQDTTFAYAYWQIAAVSIDNTLSEEAVYALKPLMQHLYKLPERVQFEAKLWNYRVAEEDPDMARRVVQSWVELYPEDVLAYSNLAEQYLELDQTDEAVKAYLTILDIDPGQYEYLLYIAEIHMNEWNFEKALKYSQQYMDQFPKDPKSYIILGFLHSFFGKHKQARSYFNEALVLEPDNIITRIKLAEIKTEMGDFSAALNDFEELLNECDAPQDRFLVYRSLENYYFLRGQVDKAIECIELRLAEQERFDTEHNIFLTKYKSLERYILAGKTSTAVRIAQEMEANLGPPQDFLIPYAYLRIYMELEQATEIEKYVEEIEASIDETQMEAFRQGTFWSRGKLLEIYGDYEGAIQHYSTNLESNPVKVFMHFHIGRCFRMNKEYKKAEEHFQKIINLHPYWPEELYEFGLLYFEWGKYDKALEYFNRAQSIWENADPEYKPAAMLREKLAEISSNSYN